jgi:hypothetical protein
MSAIENKQIIFENKVSNGRIYKQAFSLIGDPDIGHVSGKKDIEVIDEDIANLELAISGNFDQIIDPDFTNGVFIAFITPTNVEFWDYEVQNIIGYGSLTDFHELLIAWRDFILQPPFHGTKVDKDGNIIDENGSHLS